MSRKKDDRPICTCSAYVFPHKIGGKCDGSTFAEFYYYHIRSSCQTCNCDRGDGCDVANGSESIAHAECYIEAKHYNPGETLPINLSHLFPHDPQ